MHSPCCLSPPGTSPQHPRQYNPPFPREKCKRNTLYFCPVCMAGEGEGIDAHSKSAAFQYGLRSQLCNCKGFGFAFFILVSVSLDSSRWSCLATCCSLFPDVFMKETIQWLRLRPTSRTSPWTFDDIACDMQCMTCYIERHGPAMQPGCPSHVRYSFTIWHSCFQLQCIEY